MLPKDETECLTAQVCLSSDIVTKFVRQKLKKLKTVEQVPAHLTTVFCTRYCQRDLKLIITGNCAVREQLLNMRK